MDYTIQLHASESGIYASGQIEDLGISIVTKEFDTEQEAAQDVLFALIRHANDYAFHNSPE